MNVWLKNLPLELGSISPQDYIEPLKEIDGVNEHIVGEMTEPLKRLYTLWMDVERRASQRALDARYARTEEEKRGAAIKACELHAKAEVLERIFWIGIRDLFNLWDKNSIAVGKGFLVVWMEDSSNELPPFLRFLMGPPGL